jgi:tetratricopeptide (TPR) repeat protein
MRKRCKMERSEIISKIKSLAEQANKLIVKKEYGSVYMTYLKIAELCEQIGESENAESYKKAADQFKARLEVAEKEKELREAINQAIEAAKIASENKQYSRVSDIYYSVAAKLYDIGEEESAKKFSEAARKFRERAALEGVPKEVVSEVPKEIRESKKTAPISNFTEAIKFGVEIEKNLTPVEKSTIPFTPTAPSDKSETIPETGPPEAVKKSAASALEEMDIDFNKLDQFLIDLGLKCPNCGLEIKESEAGTLVKCPKCGYELSKFKI